MILGKFGKHLLSNKMSSLNHGFALYSAWDAYDTSREEGNGVGVSLMKGAFEGTMSEILKPGASIMFGLLTEVPAMAINGIDTYNQYARQLGAVQRSQAFQTAQFNDTEQAYTMRQAGMAIAERSRYNTQQAMLGNEAKYM